MASLSPDAVALALLNPTEFAASLSGQPTTGNGPGGSSMQFAGLATPPAPAASGADAAVDSNASTRLTPEERAARRAERDAQREAERLAREAERAERTEARRLAREDRLSDVTEVDPRSPETLSDRKLRNLTKAVERIIRREERAIENIDRRIGAVDKQIDNIEANNPDFVNLRNDAEESRKDVERLKKIPNPSVDLIKEIAEFEKEAQEKEALVAQSPVGKLIAEKEAEKVTITQEKEKFEAALKGNKEVLEELNKETAERKGVNSIPQLEKDLQAAKDKELAANTKADGINTTITSITKNNEALKAAVEAIDDPALKERLNKIIADNDTELVKQQALKVEADKAALAAKTEREAAEKALSDVRNGGSQGATRTIVFETDPVVGRRARLVEPGTDPTPPGAGGPAV